MGNGKGEKREQVQGEGKKQRDITNIQNNMLQNYMQNNHVTKLLLLDNSN